MASRSVSLRRLRTHASKLSAGDQEGHHHRQQGLVSSVNRLPALLLACCNHEINLWRASTLPSRKAWCKPVSDGERGTGSDTNCGLSIREQQFRFPALAIDPSSLTKGSIDELSLVGQHDNLSTPHNVQVEGY